MGFKIRKNIMSKIHLFHGDSKDILKSIDDDSIDSIVTDPPYGISFMGKDWDKALPPIEIWEECVRVLKPGGYLVAMSASRMYHRLAVQLEDLGLICHPMIGWIYGSGFPKATDLSKQFDKQAGAKRKKIGVREHPTLKKNPKVKSKAFHVETLKSDSNAESWDITTPSTDNAKKWNGYKYGLQSLKPALEPIAVFQKPWKLKEVKRMTDNIVKHGVGAFNIDACRVGDEKHIVHGGGKCPGGEGNQRKNSVWNGVHKEVEGRHPANLLHDGSECVEKVFLEQGGIRKSGDLTGQVNCVNDGNGNDYGKFKERENWHKGDSGSASRYFNKLPISDLDVPFLYCAKASKSERNAGLDDFEEKNVWTESRQPNSNDIMTMKRVNPKTGELEERKDVTKSRNNHPTVKPIALMGWLIKLVTPEGGTTCDPFMGSGTTGIAAKKNNFNFIGIERGEHNFEIAKARI